MKHVRNKGWLCLALAAVVLLPAGRAGEEEAKLNLPHRWVYISTNLLVERNVEKTLN